MGVVVALRCAVVGPGRRWLVRVAVLGRTLAWLGRGVVWLQCFFFQRSEHSTETKYDIVPYSTHCLNPELSLFFK